MRDFPGDGPIDGSDLPELEVDLLAPCAIEGVITPEDVGRVRANRTRMVIWGANRPTNPEADDMLWRNGYWPTRPPGDRPRRSTSGCSRVAEAHRVGGLYP
ncbi:hypothetical protein [Streptomyces phaeochromogenes]|uniref:hypothetical protein n=1 Tax=Streptomyces phaeochromogenes TaxID=1923 RepID=UPI00398CCB89